MDGLPAITKNYLQDLLRIANEGFKNGYLPDTQRTSVLSLIFKKGPENDIANYRPISLTNVDYRILTFTLAQRVQKIIPKLVNTDQSAYIKGRYMGTNIRLVCDIIQNYSLNQKKGMLFMLDFKKAFDSIEWSFLYKTLTYFNFGENFIRWIKVLYCNSKSLIKNNGYLSEEFTMYRGIRQGCPVSALLFILCVEILSIQIRNSKSLKGFHFGFPEKPIKVSQYADDAILCINNKDELCSAINILNNFGDISGLKLNLHKCEAFQLGVKDNSINGNSFGIKWVEQFRCLGIHLGNENIQLQKNFIEKVNAIETLLETWKKRDLTFFGKIHLLKTYALSKLILPISQLEIPHHILKKIESMFFKFLWGKASEKVSRTKLCYDIECGGLK